MKILYNRHFPFGTFWAINLFGIIVARRDLGVLGAVDCNHEYIHTLQQRELLFMGFYLLYVAAWLCKCVIYRSWRRAYFNVSFEREAYARQNDLEYKSSRPLFAWRKYLWRKA